MLVSQLVSGIKSARITFPFHILFFVLISSNLYSQKEADIIKHIKSISDGTNVDLSYYPELLDTKILTNFPDIESLTIGPYIENFDFLLNTKFKKLSVVDFSYSQINLMELSNSSLKLNKIILDGLTGEMKNSQNFKIISFREVDQINLDGGDESKIDIKAYQRISRRTLTLPKVEVYSIPYTGNKKRLNLKGIVSSDGHIQEVSYLNLKSSRKELLADYFKKRLVFEELVNYKDEPFDITIIIAN